MTSPTLVTIRFKTARASLCGVHLSGVNYEVTPEFAEQVVNQEQVAEYVTGAPAKVPVRQSKDKQKQ